MTYRGYIWNGVAVLDAPAALPDGTLVLMEVEPADSEFWRRKSVEDLARERRARPIHSLDELAIDWPGEESVDELLVLVREVRG